MKTYLVLLLLTIFVSSSFLIANERYSELASNSLDADIINRATFTSNHSKGNHSNSPLDNFTQIEIEEEEEKFKNAIKRNSSNEFVFISPFSNYLTFKEVLGSIDLKLLVVDSASLITSSTPIYLRISVFRI